MFKQLSNTVAIGLLLPIFSSMSGCSLVAGSYTRDFGRNLGYAINSHNDIETVEAALPPYLLLLDSLALKENSSVDTKLSAARLYVAYSSLFIDDVARQKKLTNRALDYVTSGLCQHHSELCHIREQKYSLFKQRLDRLGVEDATNIYVLGVSWAAWIQAHKEDWTAIAQLAQVKYILNKIIALDETVENGGAHYVLGVINTLVPPAMGGKPEVARKHFERAIEITENKNLSYQVAIAEHYARLIFDKELHDRILQQVLAQHDKQDEYTLQNTIAKKKAALLLASSDEYF